jgi:hypothetical protein
MFIPAIQIFDVIRQEPRNTAGGTLSPAWPYILDLILKQVSQRRWEFGKEGLDEFLHRFSQPLARPLVFPHQAKRETGAGRRTGCIKDRSGLAQRWRALTAKDAP